MATQATPLCPSAHPQGEGARVFAVMGGTATQPHASYLDQVLPLTEAIRALAGPVDAAEVFRVAAPCATGACQHFDSAGQACKLVRKTVQLAPMVVQRLPRCAIRTACQWWRQEGAAACRRCPQVATLNPAASDAVRLAADPHH